MESKKQKVMIVDDDQFLVGMYSDKFNKGGFEVDTANRAEDALGKLRGGYEPDILVLDVVMPSLDGVGLLGKIREEKLAKKAVVIMLTNQGQKSDIDQAEKLGIDGYLVKAETIPSEILEKVVNIYNATKDKK